MKAIWVRLICLISIVAFHGPQHHAFAHEHEQAHEQRDQCSVKVPHIESAKVKMAEPESDCLACQAQSGKGFVDLAVDREPTVQVSKLFFFYEPIEIAEVSRSACVRGPPPIIG